MNFDKTIPNDGLRQSYGTNYTHTKRLISLAKMAIVIRLVFFLFAFVFLNFRNTDRRQPRTKVLLVKCIIVVLVYALWMRTYKIHRLQQSG